MELTVSISGPKDNGAMLVQMEDETSLNHRVASVVAKSPIQALVEAHVKDMGHDPKAFPCKELAKAAVIAW